MEEGARSIGVFLIGLAPSWFRSASMGNALCRSHHGLSAGLLFSIVCLSGLFTHARQSIAAEPQVVDPAAPAGFDLRRTLHEAPWLGGSLRFSREWLGNSSGYRYVGSLDIRAVVRLGFDITRFSWATSDNDPKMERALSAAHVGLHVPLNLISLTAGGGWAWRRGVATLSGPMSYLSVGYGGLQPLLLNVSSEASLISRRVDRVLGLDTSIGVNAVQVTAGYRWLSMGGEGLSGPAIGLNVRF